jgi:hypothetical protein
VAHAAPPPAPKAPPDAAKAPPAAAKGPLAARALDGPYPTLDAWCEAARKSLAASAKCMLDETKPVALERAAAPWLGAREIQSGYFDDRALRVAVQTSAGWFVGAPEGETTPVIAAGALALVDVVPGGAPELTVRYRVVTSVTDRPEAARWSQRCTEMLAYCGLGAGGRPSCTPALPLREGGCTDPAQPVEWDWELEARPLADGRVAVQLKKGTAPAEARRFVGTHALAFP